MQITDELVDHLEALARVNLSKEEKLSTKKDLQDILSYMNTLNELDTADTEPLSHSFPITNVFHKDIVENGPNREQLLSNAPAQKDGCFKVHKTVE